VKRRLRRQPLSQPPLPAALAQQQAQLLPPLVLAHVQLQQLQHQVVLLQHLVRLYFYDCLLLN
jgi:hypothetical protein